MRCFIKIFTLSSLIILISCKNSLNNQESPSLELETYNLDINSNTVEFSESISSVELVALEETDNSLLSQPTKMAISNNYYIVFTGSGDVWIFYKNGEFYNKINKVGDGPNEYRNIANLWIESNFIHIYSTASSKILKLNYDGEVLNSKRVPFEVGHVISKKDKYYIDTNFNPIQDSLFVKAAIFDENWNPINTYLKSNDLPTTYRRYGRSTLSQVGSDILFRRMHNDTVYRLNQDELQEHIHFNLGQDWFWTDKSSTNDAHHAEISESNKVWETNSSISKKEIYIQGIVGYSHWEHFYIDREKNEIQHLKIPEIAQKTMTPTNLGWDEDWLIFSARKDLMEHMLNYFNESDLNLNIVNDSVWSKNTENPILVKVNFK